MFLDFDDVLCLSKPYGGYELFSADDRPADLYERLWHEPAKQVLLTIMSEFSPHVVLTTSWLRMAERPAFETLLRRTGLVVVADALHDHWEAPGIRGLTRHGSIERWLHKHYQGGPLVILDDELSGTGLRSSKLEQAGCVVLCKQGVGLHTGHLSLVRRAFTGGEAK